MPGTSAHPMTIKPFRGVVNVTFSDAQVASSDRALVLREADYPPVYYIPFEDVYFDLMRKSATTTRCPHKGTASYWDVTAVGESAADVMWAYETPNPDAVAIARHGAFFPDKVRIEVVEAATDEPHVS